MPRRKIKRRRGEGISISGPATVHVSRRVMLIVDAPREARVARLAKQDRPELPRAIERRRRVEIFSRLRRTTDHTCLAGRE